MDFLVYMGEPKMRRGRAGEVKPEERRAVNMKEDGSSNDYEYKLRNMFRPSKHG